MTLKSCLINRDKGRELSLSGQERSRTRKRKKDHATSLHCHKLLYQVSPDCYMECINGGDLRLPTKCQDHQQCLHLPPGNTSDSNHYKASDTPTGELLALILKDNVWLVYHKSLLANYVRLLTESLVTEKKEHSCF